MKKTDILTNLYDLGLPISGGSGDSYDDAIILYKTDAYNYPAYADVILQYIGACRIHSWNKINDALKFNKGNYFHRVNIETRPTFDRKAPVEKETYYFNISSYFFFHDLLINDEVHRDYKICDYLS